MDRANAAMQAVKTLHLSLNTRVLDSEDSESPIANFQVELDGHPAGDNRSTATVEFNQPDFSFAVSTEGIQVGDTSYTRDATLDRWESGPAGQSADTLLEDLMEGRLRIEDPAASVVTLANGPAYRVSGNLPESDAVALRPGPGEVTVWVGVEDPFVTRMEVEGFVPASEYGIPDLQDVFERSVYEFSRFDVPVAIAAPEVSTVLDSPFGPMALHREDDPPVSVRYPADWTEESPASTGIPSCLVVTACFVGEGGATLGITVEDVTELGLGALTLGEYVDLYLSGIAGVDPTFELESRRELTTPQGLTAEVLVFTLQGGDLKFSRLTYLHEGSLGFNASYMATSGTHADLEDVIAYSLGTLELRED